MGMLSLSCNSNETAFLASYTQRENWVQKDEQKEAGEGRGGNPIPPASAQAPIYSWELLM